MIERINLIEKEPFTFTYTKIIQLVVLVILLCGVAYGYQFGRAYFAQKEINTLRQSISTLKAENKALKKEAPPKIQPSSQTKLQSIFDSRTKWSIVIEDIIKPMPNTVWLTSVRQKTKTISTGGSKKKKKNQAPAPVIIEAGLVLEGETSHPRHLADFAGGLTDSPLIRKASIGSVEKGKENYKFDIDCLLLNMPN